MLLEIICISIVLLIAIIIVSYVNYKNPRNKNLPVSSLHPMYYSLPEISLPRIDKQEELYKILHTFQKINDERIETFLICGSLLGSIRNKGMIPWDRDIDLGYSQQSHKKLSSLSPILSRNGITLRPFHFGFRLYTNKDTLNVFIDLYEMESSSNKVQYVSPKSRKKYPTEWFYEEELYPLRDYTFGGVTVKGPQNPEPYLNRVYGNDWKDTGKVSKKSFDLEEKHKLCVPDPFAFPIFHNSKVDLVIPWVTDNDYAWRREREDYGGKPLSNRHGDHDELRYAIRGIEKYMSWINEVVLLVHAYPDGTPQVPKWLDQSHPRLRVVTHRDCFGKDSEDLPTFNSSAIECHVHKIPGLSEFYIYSNDDIIPLNYISRDDFQERDGRLKVFISDTEIPRDINQSDMHMKALARLNVLFDTIFGKRRRTFPSHLMNMRKRSLEYLKREFLPEEWEKTSKIKFRSPTDFIDNAFAHQYWCLENGYATKREMVHSYILMKSNYKIRRLLQRIEEIQPKMICFNDGHTDDNENKRENISDMKTFLRYMLPLPSSFEK